MPSKLRGRLAGFFLQPKHLQFVAKVSLPRKERIIAWSVHVYTLLGLVIALVSVVPLIDGRVEVFFMWQCIGIFVDGTDGTFARKFRVKEVIPEFDGAMLDNLVDFLTFAFLPSMGFCTFGALRGSWRIVAFVPLLASGYQFCQSSAKTTESFIGFPSYWNLLLLYFAVLDSTSFCSTVFISIFSILSFVPTHYIYPSRTRMWKKWNLTTCLLWSVAVMGGLYYRSRGTDVRLFFAITLVYPISYFFLSGVLHHRIISGKKD